MGFRDVHIIVLCGVEVAPTVHRAPVDWGLRDFVILRSPHGRVAIRWNHLKQDGRLPRPSLLCSVLEKAAITTLGSPIDWLDGAEIESGDYSASLDLDEHGTIHACVVRVRRGDSLAAGRARAHVIAAKFISNKLAQGLKVACRALLLLSLGPICERDQTA